MAKIVIFLLIGAGVLYGIGVAAIWLLSAFAEVGKATADAGTAASKSLGRLFSRLLIALFGHPKGARAVVTVPPECERTPWPSPAEDDVTTSLKDWTPPAIPRLKDDYPKWAPLWKERHSNPTAVDVAMAERLFHPIGSVSLPYELVESEPKFPAYEPRPYRCVPPKAPDMVPTEYGAPSIVMPSWSPALRFLNRYVEAANAFALKTYEAAIKRRELLVTTAEALNSARREAWVRACERAKAATERAASQEEASGKKYRSLKKQFEAARDSDLSPLREVVALKASGDSRALELHFDLTLRQLELPSFVPREWHVQFEPAEGILLVEHSFPNICEIELFQWVDLRTKGLVRRPLPQKAKKAVLPRIHPALCIQLACALARSDRFSAVKAFAINGWVSFFDRATGQPRKAYCASMFAKKEALLAINLATADLSAAFYALRGADAGETFETAPVIPVLTFDKNDERFIAGRDALGEMLDNQNLAAMDWDAFEHLVRQLFEKAFASTGADVRVTRASRDHGVDAVIFDPDPLRGGKIVVQAKRYTNPVDVAAVRDLYGSVINEGANKGILVTTSGYGPDAYEFAQNKNIQLLNGGQLLGLLAQHGYRFRIDLEEARRIAAQQAPR